jgi:hypothetical protein
MAPPVRFVSPQEHDAASGTPSARAALPFLRCSQRKKQKRSLSMFEFFTGSSPALGLWVLGVVILGAAMVYGVMRSGWLNSRERAVLDANTRRRQRDEDPQKASGMSR